MLIDAGCTVCASPGPSLCGACLAQLRPADVLEPPPGIERLDALIRYESVGRDLVLALKYRNRRRAVGALGRALGAAASNNAFDAVTWVPTTAARRRERGYDQAELLARSLARSRRLPVRRLLRRAPGPPQTSRTRAERLVGPVFAPRRRCGGSVLVVDDVCTTGSSLTAAAEALRRGGADEVHAVVLAVTPFSTAEVHSSHGQ